MKQIFKANFIFTRSKQKPAREQNIKILALMALTLFLSLQAKAQTDFSSAPVNVLHYDARIEPDIINKTVSGKIRIQFVVLKDNLSEIEFDCGSLTIDAVHENKTVLTFQAQNKRVKIALADKAKANQKRTIEIDYHGAPQRGIKFFPVQNQVYTVFSTSEWMVCNDAPEDKATLNLNLILPTKLGSGLIKREKLYSLYGQSKMLSLSKRKSCP